MVNTAVCRTATRRFESDSRLISASLVSDFNMRFRSGKIGIWFNGSLVHRLERFPDKKEADSSTLSRPTHSTLYCSVSELAY